jgi:hypothetical protein
VTGKKKQHKYPLVSFQSSPFALSYLPGGIHDPTR